MRMNGSGRNGSGVSLATAAAAVAAVWLLAAGVSVGAATTEEAKLPGLDAVLDNLRKGGLVIYFRHGPTDQTGLNDETADLANCSTQRNLSAEGREQATRIGNAFRALGIAVGTVATSPFCRCKDTAKLAFGRFTVDNNLYFAIDTDADKTRQLAAALRQTLSTPPAAGTNAVIVAHTANLREAAGIWPKPEGVAYVFQPLPGGRFEAVAKVLPEDWANVTKRK
jgi:phosphohistidine phosphatase SixA